MAKFTPTESQKAFAFRLQARRRDLGLTQKDVAESINRLAYETDTPTSFTSFNVANWERGHTPRLKAIQLLAVVLDVESSYLLTSEQPPLKATPSIMPQKKVIGVEELATYRGCPVWVQPHDTRYPEYCGLVHDVYDFLILSDETKIPFTKVVGTIRTIPMKSDSQILTIEEAESLDKVYMVPLGTPKEVQLRLSGWYVYDKTTRIFTQESGHYAFPLSHYGKMFAGYRDEQML